jgi:hypothetical protein
MNRLLRILVLVSLLVISLSSEAARPKRNLHKDPPDLTQGGKPDDRHDWALGPIGANGWCFHVKTSAGASQRARQILVTRVDDQGPAAGILHVDDVIVGVNGKPFSEDARKQLAEAINVAESEKGGGQLRLQVWRDGNERERILKLPVLGTYSETAPFDCSKTDRIIDHAVTYMKTRKYEPGWLGYIDGLGMLATGRDDLMPLIKKLAHDSVVPGEVLSIDKHVSMKCWHWSYKTLFLCEYFLATGDDYVLPTIREYATKIAMGQSGAGTWGHTYAAIENAGHLHGHLGGYGAINQMGLTLMIVLPLAEKCGVDNAEVRDAIVRGNNFFKYFIGKGTIPYGDHGAANEWYDDNGKSGSAAIFFDLMKNREGTQFFSEMILASSVSGREAGHTGCFWSHLWGGLGAQRGGDKALQTYMDQMNWAFTLERQPDGRMVFQGNAGEAGDKGKAKTKWDCTGARLLQLCAPRRQLYLTGKDTPTETHLTDSRIQALLQSGRLDVDKASRDQLTVDQALMLLTDPLPPTRSIGARILAERNLNVVPRLVALLDSDNRYARYGAAEALCKAGFGDQSAADKLIALMEEDDDVTFKTYAIAALINRDKQRGLLTAAKPAIPVLLRMAVKHSPDDPRRVLQHDIGRALFYNGRAQPRRGLLVEYGLDGVDREQLLAAVREILQNENGWARSTASWIYDEFSEEERIRMWPDIVKAVHDIAPSGIMFASGVRLAGVKLMAKHRIKEGVDLTAWYVRHQKGHGTGARMPQILDVLLQYGGHAKRVIPELEKHAQYFESRKGDMAKQIRETIEKINAFEDPASNDQLISIAAYLAR